MVSRLARSVLVRSLLALALLVCFVSCVSANEVQVYTHGRPHLIVQKNVESLYAVDGQDLVISFRIFNVGDRPAYDVVLTDEDLEKLDQMASLVSGLTSASWSRISPGASFTHSFVIKPHGSFSFQPEPASLSYKLTRGGRTVRTSSSSAFPVDVMTPREFSQVTASHLREWLLFAAMALFLVGVPTSMLVSRTPAAEAKKKKN